MEFMPWSSIRVRARHRGLSRHMLPGHPASMPANPIDAIEACLGVLLHIFSRFIASIPATVH